MVTIIRGSAPQMPPSIEENVTGNLALMLREAELDVVIIALPFSVPGVKSLAIYEEPFSVVFPEGHRWPARKAVKPSDLAGQNLPVLTTGHCFRDQVLEAGPGQSKTAQPEGSFGG